MKFSSVLVLALASDAALASTWFSKAIYNNWHETELERWLSDNNIPYPSPADRKDLENIVKENWQSKVVSPYSDWDTTQLQNYLASKATEAKEATKGSAKENAKAAKDAAADTKESLVSKVKASWYETEDKAEDAWSSVKGWIFDSWSESQLKAFCDKNGIPVPQPRKRDTLLATARNNYDSVAKKIGETAAYPGNWLYESWSESDLKAFLDTHGIPVPQPSSRDKLIAAVRRNSRLASLKAADTASSASASAASAAATAGDAIFESWSDSKIKEWADKNGIKVPQGSKRNELLAIARKNKAYLTGDQLSQGVSSGASVAYDSAASGASVAYDSAASGASVGYDSAASAYGAATSNVGSMASKATDAAAATLNDLFDGAINTWSDTRLKAYLDARGVPVPQAGKKDELLAAVRLNRHKAATGWTAWTFDTWTTENLKKWLAAQSDEKSQMLAEKADVTRDELLKAAQNGYAAASQTGGTAFATLTSAMAKATDYAKDSTFDTWSESDIKSYLDSYGVPVYQGTTTNELRAKARNTANYFRYGTTTPQGTLYAKLSAGAQWVLDQLKIGAASGRKEAAYQGEKMADRVAEGAQTATNRAAEATKKAKDYIKEEL